MGGVEWRGKDRLLRGEEESELVLLTFPGCKAEQSSVERRVNADARAAAGLEAGMRRTHHHLMAPREGSKRRFSRVQVRRGQE